jgi:hypothetical protein
MTADEPVEFPDDGLREALQRLGEQGARAERFLTSSAEQLSDRRSQAGELAAYAVREALMSLVSLGGQREPGVSEAAHRVVTAWKVSGAGEFDAEALAETIGNLEQALVGPGPNERRLESAITKLGLAVPNATRVRTRGASMSCCGRL